VEVVLTESITTERDVTFPAGAQTLNGRLATEFVRAKTPGGEAGRLQRQEQLMDALQKKLWSGNFAISIPDLLDQFQGAIVTDLSPEQILSLVCAFEQIPDSSESFKTIMGNAYITTGTDGKLMPKFGEIKNFLQVTFGN
jgi:anionic cell wall polymer biosynthesis LytR-Cps2A-Psr (LCP) family protein